MRFFRKKDKKEAPKTERRLLRFFELGKLNYYVNRYGLRIVQFHVLPNTIRTDSGPVQTVNYYVLCEGVFPAAKNNDLTTNGHERNHWGNQAADSRMESRQDGKRENGDNVENHGKGA